MKTHKFARKPLYVDAVRVTRENIKEVAEWCDGKISVDNEEASPTHGQEFIQVRVHRPINDRQTQAFIGDWVLFAKNGFKVYTAKAFDKSFDKVKTLNKEQADAAGIKVPHEPRRKPKKPVRQLANPVLRNEQAEMLKKPSDTQVKFQSEKDEADKLIDEVLRNG